MNVFQVVVVGTFLAFAILGVVLFAGFGGLGKKPSVDDVEIWGTQEALLMDEIVRGIDSGGGVFKDVHYRVKDERTYYDDLVEALASGSGPDLFLLDQDFIIEHQEKLHVIPYDVFTEREFKDYFVEEGELYLKEGEGMYGIPFMLDPLVMYWNRDIFSAAGVARPPQLWDEFFTLVSDITKIDQSSNILQATVSLGEYKNITYAKEILTTLIKQAGNEIAVRDSKKAGGLSVVLDDRSGFAAPPAEAALRFYTEFSNPVKAAYSWNRALPSSRNAFLAGDLAIYFGFASELSELREANPNLNFDIALMPQSRGNEKKTTFGSMKAFAIPKTSKNIAGAIKTAFELSSQQSLRSLNEKINLPPVSRELLSENQTEAYKSVFYDSALISNAWLDPNKKESDEILKNMVESVTSGKLRISNAIRFANNELQNITDER